MDFFEKKNKKKELRAPCKMHEKAAMEKLICIDKH